jgi:hypothetical protein
MSACATTCVRCHRELIKGGRVQFGVLWGDAPPRVLWDRRLMPWPSIGLCGPCSLALADWITGSPSAGPGDGEARAEPAWAGTARGGSRRGRARGGP